MAFHFWFHPRGKWLDASSVQIVDRGGGVVAVPVTVAPRAGLPASASRRRTRGPERHLASAQYRQLGPRGSLAARGDDVADRRDRRRACWTRWRRGRRDSLPSRRARSKENQPGQSPHKRPRSEMLSAGDSPRELYALPISNRAVAAGHSLRLRIRERESPRKHG